MNVTEEYGREGGSRLGRVGRGVGLLAMAAGLLGSGYLLVTFVVPYLFADGGTLAAENAPIIFCWSVVIIVLSFGVGIWAWTGKVWRVWGLAVVVSVLTVLSLFSIGRVIAPFAALSVLAAVLLTTERRTAT